MKRKYIAPLLAVVLLAGCSQAVDGQAGPQTSVTVSPEGGSYVVGGLTVTVPKGAVAKPTSLTVGQPRQVSGSDAPLGATTVRFDISLADGAEPAQPLQVAIPLRGQFLPTSADPAHAVFYTSTADGKGFRLLPYDVQNGVLTATVPHLSDKEIAYIDPQTVAKSIARTQPAPAQSDCTKQQLPNVGEVDVTASNNGNGRVSLCLKLDGDNLALHLADKSDYTWSVQSPNVQFTGPPQTIDDTMAQAIATALLPEPSVHSYLVHGDELVVKGIKPQDLPFNLQLLVSNNGLMGEALWDVVKSAVEVYTGENTSDVAKWAKAVIVDAADVNNCLAATLKAKSGNIGDFVSALPDAVFSKCGEVIGAALIKLLPDTAAQAIKMLNPFTKAIKFLEAVWDLLKDGWHTAVAVNQTGLGAVKVTIAPACPTKEQVDAMLKQSPQINVMGGNFVESIPPIVCDGDWMEVGSHSRVIDPTSAINPWDYDTSVLFHRNNGQWTVDMEGTSRHLFIPEYDAICGKVPAKIKAVICTK